jgi:hypothetical protein
MANILPHWYCLAGNTRLLWTAALGDLFIGVSYYSQSRIGPAVSGILLGFRILHRPAV